MHNYHHRRDDHTPQRSQDSGHTSAEEQAERLIREAERFKARILDPKGEETHALLHSVIIDEGYLQVAVHKTRL